MALGLRHGPGRITATPVRALYRSASAPVAPQRQPTCGGRRALHRRYGASTSRREYGTHRTWVQRIANLAMAKNVAHAPNAMPTSNALAVNHASVRNTARPRTPFGECHATYTMTNSTRARPVVCVVETGPAPDGTSDRGIDHGEGTRLPRFACAWGRTRRAGRLDSACLAPPGPLFGRC